MEPERNALEVADKFIRLGIENENLITPLKAQKLVFLAHAWSLGLGFGPLFQDAVEAWQYGPVVRMLYHELKGYGNRTIAHPIMEEEATFDEGEEAFIKAIWRHYGEIPALSLSAMTHAPGSPWDQVYRRGYGSQIIHTHLIRDYYRALAERN